jgi:RNA polymerase sigma factor (sigma-70 family)
MLAAATASFADLDPLEQQRNPPAMAAQAPRVDVVLMQEAAGGSEAAFSQLIHRHQHSLVNFFVRMGASSDSEDLVQETFIRLFRYRRQYKPVAGFTAFLYHLARNVWADRGRKILRRERLASACRLEAEIAQQSPHEPRDCRPDMDVTAGLNKLSPKLREVIVLNIYQGLRYQEVADALNIPLGTVKSRISLALDALRKILHED